ncbi:glycoside hydrolase/deacetylase, partial [Anaeromyces robustus]
ITFDDGPYIYDEALLDLLKSLNAKATFFINGNTYMDARSEQGRRILKRMYDEGHTVACHTYNHIDITAHSLEEFNEELVQVDTALEEIIGVKPTFFRPPYGRGAYDENIQRVLQNNGYTGIIMWEADSNDWDNKGDIDYALGEMEKVLGAPFIVVNHNRYDDMTQDSLLNLVRAEIEYMSEHGYTSVSMDECTGRSAYR